MILPLIECFPLGGQFGSIRMCIFAPQPLQKSKPDKGWISPFPFGQFDKKVCKTKPNFFYNYEENVVDGHSFI